jgi:tRNA-2-methylthio-N6-dimethylallyladenosine synthase
MENIKSFFILTYGCQMNELDSEVIAGELLKLGLKAAKTEEETDLLIFNTCSIRDLAEQKVIGKVGLIGRKKKRPIIGIAGCMAVAKKDFLLKKFKHIDFLIGPNNIADLPKILNNLVSPVCRITPNLAEEPNFHLANRQKKIKAYVSIIRGCNKFCTYCIVPFTRGREVSRPPESILEECQKLVDQGYKEITLLGQNVNSFGKDHPEWRCSFSELLYRLDKIKGLNRLRFLTSHPVDITSDVIATFKELPSLCEFLHFPTQSGSNTILKKMNRHYTKEEYLEKIALLLKAQPKMTFGTDIIVGFPGESEQDFQETAALFERVNFANAYIFAYSPREHTAAFKLIDDVPLKIKEARLQHMLALYNTLLEKRLYALIKQNVEVLVERKNKDDNLLKGHTRGAQKVIFKGDEKLIGSLQMVTIKGFKDHTLIGDAIDSEN